MYELQAGGGGGGGRSRDTVITAVSHFKFSAGLFPSRQSPHSPAPLQLATSPRLYKNGGSLHWNQELILCVAADSVASSGLPPPPSVCITYVNARGCPPLQSGRGQVVIQVCFQGSLTKAVAAFLYAA